VQSSSGRLIKVDTIGDAYIIVGWLPCSDEADSERKRLAERAVCMEMLVVAGELLQALEACSSTTGVNWHARIGIGVGDAIAGVLGRLQPRFAVYGEGFKRAAELERGARQDAVRCSPLLMHLLTQPLVDGDDGQVCGQAPSDQASTCGEVAARRLRELAVSDEQYVKTFALSKQLKRRYYHAVADMVSAGRLYWQEEEGGGMGAVARPEVV